MDSTHDTLEWHESTPLSGPLIYTAFTSRGKYSILRMTNGMWHTERMDHPLMPPFNGSCPTLDAAKRACERDFVGLARADRWLDYMRDNEPPAWALGGV